MYMSNICKTVTLRTRKIKGGEQLSFYLDYYPGYRDESTMKVMRHESLGIYIYAKPKSRPCAAVATRASSTSAMISSTRRR